MITDRGGGGQRLYPHGMSMHVLHRCSQWGAWHDGGMSEREILFAIYEEALVAALDPTEGEWIDPALECLSRSRGCVVMTAYNPGAARPSWAQNEAANAQMYEVLVNLGYEVWQADGFSADGTWREPGWLVWGMDPREGARIAAEFGQYAVYAYDQEGVRVVVACELAEPDIS